MKKTIFTKLMQLSLSVILVSSLVLGLIHFFLISQYINANRIEMLGSNAGRINQLIQSLSFDNSVVAKKLFQINLDAVAKSTQSYIIMIDRGGHVIYYSSEAQPYLSGATFNVQPVADAFNGKTVTKVGMLDDLFGRHTLTVAGPLGTGDNVYGLVLLTAPVPTVSREVISLLSLLLISILASIAVAMILSYVLSANMTKQIRQLSRVAQEIARGEFNKRGALSDVQELSELGKSFNSMAEELEKQDKVRTSFIANVSHDLRTPMTTISGFVQGILDGTIPPEREREYLSVVLSESKRLSDLVNTFLDLSRYESGEMKLHKITADINEMLRGILLSFESIITEKDIAVDLSFNKEKCPVLVDELAMQRVIVNLIDNATKFTEQGGTIHISVIRKKGKTFVSIENSGAQLTDEELKFIWHRFYKSDQSRTRDKKGTGLGLYIVKNIVNLHNEKILVESKDNHVKFTFTLQNAKS